MWDCGHAYLFSYFEKNVLKLRFEKNGLLIIPAWQLKNSRLAIPTIFMKIRGRLAARFAVCAR